MNRVKKRWLTTACTRRCTGPRARGADASPCCWTYEPTLPASRACRSSIACSSVTITETARVADCIAAVALDNFLFTVFRPAERGDGSEDPDDPARMGVGFGVEHAAAAAAPRSEPGVPGIWPASHQSRWARTGVLRSSRCAHAHVTARGDCPWYAARNGQSAGRPRSATPCLRARWPLRLLYHRFYVSTHARGAFPLCARQPCRSPLPPARDPAVPPPRTRGPRTPAAAGCRPDPSPIPPGHTSRVVAPHTLCPDR